jgi:exodeoxyribonuclease VIII
VGKTKDGRDSERSAAAKQMRDEWFTGLEPDAILVSQDDADAICGMIESVQGHPDACAALKRGIPERSCYAEINLPGGYRAVGMKSRPDYIREDGTLVDLKTTIDAGFEPFRAQIRKFDWDTQAAIGVDVLKQITGHEQDFIWIAVEKEPPYCCAVYVANDVPLEIGRKRYRRAVETYLRCLETDRWPFQESAQNMDSPYWAMFEDGDL